MNTIIAACNTECTSEPSRTQLKHVRNQITVTLARQLQHSSLSTGMLFQQDCTPMKSMGTTMTLNIAAPL